MRQSIQIVILGLTLGGVYALMASGLTLIFGVMGIVNLAHAAFMVLAAFMAFFAFKYLGLDPILSIAFVMPAMFLVGIVVYRLLFARALADPHKRGVTVLVTFALALIVEGVLGYLFSNIYRSTRPSYASDAILVGPFYPARGAVLRDAALDRDPRRALGFPAIHAHRLRHPRHDAQPHRRGGGRRQCRPHLDDRLRHRHGARRRLGLDALLPLLLLPEQALGVGGDPARRSSCSAAWGACSAR